MSFLKRGLWGGKAAKDAPSKEQPTSNEPVLPGARPGRRDEFGYFMESVPSQSRSGSDGTSMSGGSSLALDFTNASSEIMRDIKCEVMVNWIHTKQEEKLWTVGERGEGVVLKKSKGRYVCCPTDLQDDPGQFYQQVALLNVRVCSPL